MSNLNVFLYWEGKEYKLIKLLRNLIYLHSLESCSYKTHLITPENLKQYVNDLPECFDKLNVAHKADYIRVAVVNKYGGIWLDSDTLVLDKLDSLFEPIVNGGGFLVTEGPIKLCNGVFGSVKGSPLLKEWLKEINLVLKEKGEKIDWCEIGQIILEKLRTQEPHLFDKFTIIDGPKSIYPINWTHINFYLEASYHDYKEVIRENQPLLILTHPVYHELEGSDFVKFLNEKTTVLNYFLNKSYDKVKGYVNNMSLVDLANSNHNDIMKIAKK